ncbi:MAG: F0F1 ATP synthase subunit epsilon [Nitrospirae bacterium]|nr:F0F1 ATP synthase subunit epsilon [Nitrospirota bacterium]
MAEKLLLEVVTPDKLLLSKEVDEVIAPGAEGEFGVLPGHSHFLSTLKIGTPKKVTILAEIAEKAEDIDVERATAKVAEMEKRLEVGGLPSELKEAQISLEKARLRKKIAERAHRK